MKISVISTGDKVTGPANTTVFVVAFITERNAKSQFKVRKNEDILSASEFTESPELQVPGPQVRMLALESSFISADSPLKKVHRRPYRGNLDMPGMKLTHTMSIHIILERI